MNENDPIELKLEALKFMGREENDKGLESCPSDETFAAYMEDHLPNEEAETIKSHITSCSDCNLVYSAWLETNGIEGSPVPAELLEKARSLIKPPITHLAMKLLKKAFKIINPEDVSLKSAPQAALGATRKSGALPSDQYEIVEIKSELPYIETVQVQHLEDSDSLKLTLIPSKDSQADDLNKIRIDIYQDSRLVQSWPLYMEGTSLNPLEKGKYRIALVKISPAVEGRQVGSIGAIELSLD